MYPQATAILRVDAARYKLIPVKSTPVKQSAVGNAVALVLTACTGGGTVEQTSEPRSTTTSPATTTDPTPTTMVPSTSSTTTSPATTTAQIPETPYAVVAWESGRSLVVIESAAGEGAGCPERPDPIAAACGILAEVGRVQLADPPHNLATSGSLVFATQPSTGGVTRLDLSTGEVTTVAVGAEPHDVDFSEDGTRLFVTDEAGRQLIEIDPVTLDQVGEVALPGPGHDSVVTDDGDIWTTLVGRDELAFITGAAVRLLPTGSSPHDVLVDAAGMVWFSNWGSAGLNVIDPEMGTTTSAPAGVIEPHHFALDADGRVWVSDNGGDSVVAFTPGGPVATIVGLTPHHLALLGDVMVVAVSGSGEIVGVADQRVVSRLPVGTGLHGVAVGEAAGLTLPP